MEFDVEIAPYLRLAYDHHKITVEYQKGNIGYPGTLPPAPSCEKSNIQLNYFIYQYFTRERDLTETEYFAAIETMLSVNSIRRSATQVKDQRYFFFISGSKNVSLLSIHLVCSKGIDY